MKDGFLLYKGFWEPIKDLSDEQLGRLFRAIYEYQVKGATETDPDIKMAFMFFLNQFHLDEKKYQAIVERNRGNGTKGGRPKKNPSEPKKPTGLIENPKNPSEPKKADKDKEKEKDKDKDKGKDICDNDLSFVNDGFRDLVLEFIRYRKKDIKKPFKTNRGVVTFYNNLMELSNCEYLKAKELIEYAKGKEWQTVYPIKKDMQKVTDKKPSKSRSYKNEEFWGA